MSSGTFFLEISIRGTLFQLLYKYEYYVLSDLFKKDVISNILLNEESFSIPMALMWLTTSLFCVSMEFEIRVVKSTSIRITAALAV